MDTVSQEDIDFVLRCLKHSAKFAVRNQGIPDEAMTLSAWSAQVIESLQETIQEMQYGLDVANDKITALSAENAELYARLRELQSSKVTPIRPVPDKKSTKVVPAGQSGETQ